MKNNVPVMSPDVKLQVVLPQIGQALEKTFKQATGLGVCPFVVVVQPMQRALFVNNTTRADAAKMLKSVWLEWDKSAKLPDMPEDAKDGLIKELIEVATWHHNVADTLFAALITADPSFRPTQSDLWPRYETAVKKLDEIKTRLASLRGDATPPDGQTVQ